MRCRSASRRARAGATALALGVVVVLVTDLGCQDALCCLEDTECESFARCFEGTCRPRCDDASACLDGEVCKGGVCLLPRRDPNRCGYQAVTVIPVEPPPVDDAGTSDGGAPDAGAPPVDAGSHCPGPEEPNDSLATATEGVVEGEFDLCDGDDVDFFARNAPSGTFLNVSVNFIHADGDIDIEVLDPNGVVVDRSQGIENEEFVSHRVTTGGVHYVRVYAFGASGNSYSILMSVFTN